MKGPFIVQKALNNNVMIATSTNEAKEVIFIGKGIGFGKKPGDVLEEQSYDKVFTLFGEEEQQKYLRLLKAEKEEDLAIIYDSFEKIREWMGKELHERVHYALSQHLILAIERARSDLDIHNPFLTETKWLYGKTYNIAEDIVQFIYEKTGTQLPEAEIGFITLHLQSAILDHNHLQLKENTEFISRCVSYVEEKLNHPINTNSIPFQRFVQHLKELLDRSLMGDLLIEEKILNLLKKENPLCYNISRNIVRSMEKRLDRSIANVEIIYLSLHIQRLIKE